MKIHNSFFTQLFLGIEYKGVVRFGRLGYDWIECSVEGKRDKEISRFTQNINLMNSTNELKLCFWDGNWREILIPFSK